MMNIDNNNSHTSNYSNSISNPKGSPVSITTAQYSAINECLKRLNIMRRWTSFETRSKYNELAKQSLNCLTAFFLGCYAQNEGQEIVWENFPKIAIFRAYAKAYVYYDTRTDVLERICQIGGIPREAFSQTAYRFVEEKNGSREFADFISKPVLADEETFELRIYRAATKIATLVELVENGALIRGTDEYSVKLVEIQRDILAYEDMPGVRELSDINSEMFGLLLKISKLRNQNRWAVCPYHVDCSVLGHLFDTGIFAYFLALEQGWGEETATKMFWMGIWHDIAEVWTSDIPSPIKDRIVGFRRATEEFEMEMMEQCFYSKVPTFIADMVRGVMMEEEANAPFKSIMKTADYMSADSECWRQYVAGTRDPYFWRAMNRNLEKWAAGILPMPAQAYAVVMSWNRYVSSLNLW